MLDKIVKLILKPEIIVWIAVIIFYGVSKIGFKLNYLSVSDIVKNHINCFRSETSKKLMVVPIVNYCIIPFLLGASAASIKTLDESIINIVTIIVSILTAMFFTLLSVIIEMKAKIKSNPDYYRTEAEISKKSLIETYYTVMFEILVSIILLVLCLFFVFTKVFGKIQSFLVYSMMFLLIINLLMIIKRIFRVIDTDMKK